MVESRNLCPFEKSILLALIGSIIQPNKLSSGEMRIDKNYAQVGDLLQIFCNSLEEQIQHRKYFYKSASLVREGMVVVHNTGITGDPSNATVSSLCCAGEWMMVKMLCVRLCDRLRWTGGCWIFALGWTQSSLK